MSRVSRINLSASWINMMLYMLEIVLVVYYLSTFRDKKAYRYIIVAAFAMDTASTVAINANVWIVRHI